MDALLITILCLQVRVPPPNLSKVQSFGVEKMVRRAWKTKSTDFASGWPLDWNVCHTTSQDHGHESGIGQCRSRSYMDFRARRYALLNKLYEIKNSYWFVEKLLHALAHACVEIIRVCLKWMYIYKCLCVSSVFVLILKHYKLKWYFCMLTRIKR